MKHSNIRPPSFIPEIRRAIAHQQFAKAEIALSHQATFDSEWFLLKALCLKGRDDFSGAINVLTHIKRPYNNEYFTILSSCYEHLENYMQAANVLTHTSNWQTNLDAVMTIASFYEKEASLLSEETPKRQELLNLAMITYQSYPNYDTTKSTALALAELYTLKGAYQEALSLYLNIPPGNNHEENQVIKNKVQQLRVQLYHQAQTYAEHYLQQGHYQAALEQYTLIPNALKNIPTLLNQALCYKQLGQHLNTSLVYADLFYNRTSQNPDYYHAMMWYRDKHQQQMQCYQSVHQHSIFSSGNEGHQSIQVAGDIYHDTELHVSSSSTPMARRTGFNHG